MGDSCVDAHAAFCPLIWSEVRLASRCLVRVQLRRWRGDGEPLPIPVIDPPDDFDAVIEDRYAVVAGHYHDVLIFKGAGRAFGCKSAGSLSGAGLGMAGDGSSIVLLSSECVASRLVASDDRGRST